MQIYNTKNIGTEKVHREEHYKSYWKVTYPVNLYFFILWMSIILLVSAIYVNPLS